MKIYREQVWHFLVREWRGDRLCIATNGQTDNEGWAVEMALNNPRSAHVFNCWTDEIIYRNY